MARTRITTALIVLAGIILGGIGWAQQGDEAPRSPEGEKLAPSQAVAVGSDELERELATLTGPEKVERSAAKIKEMQELLTNTQEMLETVRETERDVLKLNCINEKLAAMKGFLKVGEQSYVSLEESVEEDDVEAANQQYTLIDVASKKVRNLHEEAQVCAGEVIRYADDTVVDRSVDPDIADIDIIDRDDEYEDGYVRDRLPELTPYQ